ncbi:hypothetical protein [Bradyrhizobium sp. USDA 377]
MQPGGVANRNKLPHPGSLRHGRCAEAGGKAEAGGQHRDISPDIVNPPHPIGNRSTVVRSNAIASTGFTIGEDCRVGEARQQLQRWLSNKLQTRQGSLGRVQRVGRRTTDAPFSPTCTDTITHKNYVDCVETKVFLGDYRNRAYWICSSLSAGNKFQVADLKRPKR